MDRTMRTQPNKMYPTIGCCGLDCGLCPRYYTTGRSKCPGCDGPDFYNKHPSCGYITCCVTKKRLDLCAQCDEFICSKFDSSFIDGGHYDSFLTYKKAYQNQNFVRQFGIEKFIEKQQIRIKLLELLLNDFEDGRSKSFYCIATTLLPIEDIETSVAQTKQQMTDKNISFNDRKTKAKILKRYLNDVATREGIELKLRKKAQT